MNINEAVQLVASGSPAAEVTAQLEGLFDGVKVGAEVSVVDDPAYPFTGTVGKVKSINGAYAQVEFPNKGVCPLLINQLLPVAKP